MPELEIAIARPKRWDVPFDDGMSEADVDRLLAIEPFRGIDAAAFPPSLPLRGILRGDARIAQFEPGDLIVREGDYGHSAFLILAGTVRVVLARLDPQLLGRSEPPRRSWWDACAQLWRNAELPEVRHIQAAAGSPADGDLGLRDAPDGTRVFLQDVPRLLESTGTVQLAAGEFFGELAALARTPRTATVFADSETSLLEVRWQGLRDLMRRTPAIREHIEALYRENSLRVHLRQTPLLHELPADALDRVARATIFESYGNFDWYSDFGPQRRTDPAAEIAAEPLIAAEGETPTDLVLIRSGFARQSRRHGHGHLTVAYLGKGQVFGWKEFAAAHDGHEPQPWQHSLRAVGYVDILRIPAQTVVNDIIPNCKMQVGAAVGTREELHSTFHGATELAEVDPQTENLLDSSTLEYFADHRLLNGTETMLINLDRCTRCDDCVRACAATHDNNPRFVREGPKYGNLQVAHACMHCIDPVCMIGCPTGAIGRDADTGTVRINDRTCIGCATCANSCPYEAIHMAAIREPAGGFYIDETTKQPIVKATKCDFCTGQLTGPACQHACPHDALVRIDLSDRTSLANWLGR